MHISDGILSSELVIATSIISFGFLVYSLKNLKNKNIAHIAAMGAIFFISSFIHIPLGPIQIHLVLLGVIGIIIGSSVFFSLLIALLLQALLLGFGGITSLGANLLIMALPAYITYIFIKIKLFNFFSEKVKYFLIGVIPIFISTIFLALVLLLSKKEYLYASYTIILANIPAMIIEGLITMFLINYIKKSMPELLSEVNL